MIASASTDTNVKLLDFTTGEVIRTGATSDRSKF